MNKVEAETAEPTVEERNIPDVVKELSEIVNINVGYYADATFRVIRDNLRTKRNPDRKLTLDEYEFCMQIAKKYRLDPLTKQIYFFENTKTGAIQPVVGYDGFVKLVLENPMYDGHSEIKYTYNQNGSIQTASMAMYRKDCRHSIPCTIYIKEFLPKYLKDDSPWKTRPAWMSYIRTFCQNARVAFGFSDIIDEEEARIRIELGLLGDKAEVVNDVCDTVAEPKPERKSEPEQAPPGYDAETTPPPSTPHPDANERPATQPMKYMIENLWAKHSGLGKGELCEMLTEIGHPWDTLPFSIARELIDSWVDYDKIDDKKKATKNNKIERPPKDISLITDYKKKHGHVVEIPEGEAEPDPRWPFDVIDPFDSIRKFVLKETGALGIEADKVNEYCTSTFGKPLAECVHGQLKQTYFSLVIGEDENE